MAAEHISLTPFAALLQEYMWSCRPPLNAHKLAHRLGVGRQTVYNWLNAGTIPQAMMLPNVAHLTGISLSQLYEACGYPIPDAPPSRSDASPLFEIVDPRLFDALISAIETDPAYGSDDRARLIHDARAMKDLWLAKHPDSATSERPAVPWLRAV
ncbi:MAG TPA: helix-turn-helix domain-containing protein [Ktedonobacterales bacterium]